MKIIPRRSQRLNNKHDGSHITSFMGPTWAHLGPIGPMQNVAYRYYVTKMLTYCRALTPNDATELRPGNGLSLAVKPEPSLVLTYCQSNPYAQTSVKIYKLLSNKRQWKILLSVKRQTCCLGGRHVKHTIYPHKLGSFNCHGLILMTAWISNYIHLTVRDAVIHLF